MAHRRRLKTLYDVPFLRVLPYLAIPIILYLFMVMAPLTGAVYFSLNHIFGDRFTWNGLANYRELIGDKYVLLSLKNNLILIVVSIVGQVVPAFVIVALMAANLVYGTNKVRAIFYFPVVVSPLVTAYIWKLMYNTELGIINGILRAVGLASLQRSWLSDPSVIMLSISIPLAWQYIGFYLVILLAGYTAIDRDLLEAAEIDGAAGFQRTRYIIWPLMTNTVNVCLLLCVSGGIKIFDQVFAISGGGPGYASTVLAMYAFTKSFTEADFGYGATVSVSMLLIGFAVVAVLMLVRRRGTDLE